MGDRALALLMETICSTGIRVSEVQYITVEAAKNGKTEIALKGKIRTILLPPSSAASCSSSQRRKNRLRRDLSRQKRQVHVEISNLVENEKAVRSRRCQRRGSFPAQSAPPVRDGILSRIQGYRQAGGCSRAFEHRNDAHLPCYEHGGASASARTLTACIIKTESIFRICKGSEKILSLPLLIKKYSTTLP